VEQKNVIINVLSSVLLTIFLINTIFLKKSKFEVSAKDWDQCVLCMRAWWWMRWMDETRRRVWAQLADGACDHSSISELLPRQLMSEFTADTGQRHQMPSIDYDHAPSAAHIPRDAFTSAAETINAHRSATVADRSVLLASDVWLMSFATGLHTSTYYTRCPDMK